MNKLAVYVFVGSGVFSLLFIFFIGFKSVRIENICKDLGYDTGAYVLREDKSYCVNFNYQRLEIDE